MVLFNKFGAAGTFLAAAIITDGLVAATTANLGTFNSPAARVRPKFRYWLPDASVDPALVATDIQSIGALGAGGIQFNNDYSNGGAFGVATDWDVYGFGLPAYNKVLKAAATAAKANGLIMDLAIGPAAGQGVPAAFDNPGLSYNLIPYNITVAPGGSYNGRIPGFGNGGTLVSVSTALIVNVSTVSITGIGPAGFEITYPQTLYTVSAGSITDITSTVNKNGTISISFPADSDAIQLVIYAAYYALSGDRACAPGPNPQTFLQNGSFVVDHFSATGAKVTTDFLEQYVMVNGVQALLQQIGGYLWEDSVEIPSPRFWTPTLQATFLSQHGYNIGKYIMLLAQGSGLQFMVEYPVGYITDAPDQGQGYVSDWRSTMTYLSGTYYQHLVDWSHSYLNSKFSAQVGYNMPVDMLQVVPIVDVPEDESLSFGDNIDAYRQFSGPANIAGKPIISNEIGANILSAYQVSFPALLSEVKKAYSGGTNQLVIHGATYSWNFTKTTWPGCTSYGYLFSEQHSRHQPAWTNGYSDILGYLSRSNFILQAGVPKRDVAFWDKTTSTISPVASKYTYTDLAAAGYSYEYLSPENFQLSQAVVSNKVLAASGPAYKALIIRGTDILTLAGATTIAQYAKSGLPLVISGGIPTQIASPTGLAAAQKILKDITSLSNVYQVATGAVAATLSGAGIVPMTSVSANATWYTQWREDSTAKASYIFVYNSGSYSTGSISFASTRIPYFYDAWTGEQIPVFQYTVASGRTTIPLKLAADQTIIVAFLTTAITSCQTSAVHVNTAPTSVLGFSYTDSTGLVAKVPYSNTATTIVTSDSVKHVVAAQKIATPFALGNWTLVAESWTSPADPTDLTTVAVKTNTTYILPTLQSWPLIPGLESAAGVGYYNTTFTWDNTSVGAVIDFGRVVHTLRVKVNGVALPVLDLADATADISAYLVKGTNTVQATVATALYNALIPIWFTLETAGAGPVVPPISGPLEAGLVGTVTITPYAAVKL